ncbi:MAG: hypothetical protein JXA25_16080 [Anaerolineales bacterium]|nr:hypothetical protein [Anaerolineales bacterium]
MPHPVQYSSVENKPSLCLFPWAGGRLDVYQDLIQLLKEDCSIYGIEARGLYGEAPPHLTLEQMADDYIQELLPVLSLGSVILAGASMGGKVAFEMARRLEKGPLPSPLVVMFDSRIMPLDKKLGLITRVRLHQSILDSASLGGILQYAIQKTRTRLRRRIYSYFIKRGHPLPPSINKLGTITYLVSKAYRPQPYGGRVILFRAGKLEPGTPPDPFNGWGKACTGGLEIKPIEASHTSILEEPAVSLLAAEMRFLISEIS